MGWNIWKIWGNDGLPPFSGTIVHFDQVLAGKKYLSFVCEFESSGNSVMHCKGGTLPKKRWISKDVWTPFCYDFGWGLVTTEPYITYLLLLYLTCINQLLLKVCWYLFLRLLGAFSRPTTYFFLASFDLFVRLLFKSIL